MPISGSDTIIRDFFLGFVRIHVLHHAAEEPVYGLALIEELGRHGYNLSPGTLYPLLRRLEAAGSLRSERRNDEGRIRKYYTATPVGRRVLKKARVRIRELVEEVVSGPEQPDP